MLLRSIKTVFLLFTASLCFLHLQAQIKFTASISPAKIGINETAELKLMVENAQRVQQISPPSLKDFIIVSGPNQESYVESINGMMEVSIGVNYLLKPKAKGNFTIAAATAIADGKTLKSNPVNIKVTNANSGNPQNNTAFSPFSGMPGFDRPISRAPYKDFILKKGENVQEKVSKNLFIKVDVSKQSCYIGEPIVVTYKLYTRLKSESNIIKSPSFNGFSVIDLLQPGNNDYKVEKLNGREYNVYTLRKSQLCPLQAGEIELESAEVENNIHFIKEEFANQQQDSFDDIFQDFAGTSIPAEGIQDEKLTLQSTPVIISVKPLPEANKPASFKGAVGAFEITGSVEKSNITTDDESKLSIVIAGEGNMPLINAPDINWPEGIEGFESRVSEKINKMQVPVSGEKYFDYPFTVSKEGHYILPAVEFNYFDLKSETYKTLSTQTIPLTVSKGTGKPLITVTDINPKSKEEKFFDGLFNNRLWIVIPIALIILTGLSFWIVRERKKEHHNTIDSDKLLAASQVSKEFQVPKNPLSGTVEKLMEGDVTRFYKTLNIELRLYLSNQLQIPLEEINKKRIAEETDKKGIAVNTSLALQQLLDDIEWQLYTPFAQQDKMSELYERANALIHSFNIAKA